MTPTGIDEYSALRATIRERGTARVWIVLLGVAAWALASLAAVAAAASPAVAMIPLAILFTTFEITFALHTGVERIGRYIQVFFEAEAEGRGWEHRIMEFARQGGPPRLSTDPLFARCFWLAGALNLIPAIAAGPYLAEWIVLGVAHLLFAARVLLARREAAGQRAADLARFQQIRTASQQGKS